MYEAARTRVSKFIGACCPKEVIWTRNTTEAINLVAYSWGRANIHRGDRILLTELEHHFQPGTLADPGRRDRG